MRTRSDPGDITEPCVDCRRDTPHRVRVELRTAGNDTSTDAFSLEPSRVSVCNVEDVLRMNSA